MTLDMRDAPDSEEQPPPSDVPVAEAVLAVPRYGPERREACCTTPGSRERSSPVKAAQAIHETT